MEVAYSKQWRWSGGKRDGLLPKEPGPGAGLAGLLRDRYTLPRRTLNLGWRIGLTLQTEISQIPTR